ncbi:MAG TPA: NosD domain-containing protein, partial [Acidobacteriota bacterium]|nr:NosD domain-containing protein [Acidobacteriota bacterium]
MSTSRAGPGRRIGVVTAAVIVTVFGLAPDISADVYYRMLFERAVFLLETRIEPLDAVPIFQEIIRRHGDDRPYAARSQLYIGLCYKKAGSDQALQAFREVVKNYPEQTAVTRIAESELKELRVEIAEPGRGPKGKAARLVRRFEEGQKIVGLSVDGRYVALVEMETDGLMIYDRAKQEARRLDRSRLAGLASGSAERATISPDGTRVVYSWRHGNGEIELRSIRADGTGAKTLLSDPSIVGIDPVSWGPAGDRLLAVLSGARAATQMAFIATSDGSIEPVLDLGARWPGRVLLSPNGRLLAYSLSDDPMNQAGGLFLYSIDEKKTVPLVRPAANERLLAWTPDGGGVIYAGGGSGTAGIWIMSVNNGLPFPPARWIAEETGPIDPIRLTQDGLFYCGVDSGEDPAARSGRAKAELWIWPHFLPAKSRVLAVPDRFPSIQAAIDAANAGDTVLIREGTYKEAVVIGKPLHVQGEGRQTTKILGSGVGTVVRITAGDVSVSGITVAGGTDGIEIASGPNVRRVSLTDVVVAHNSRDGIHSAKTGGYHLIEGCTVSDNGQYGMNVHQFLRSVIRDCEVLRNGTGLRPAWSWHILVEGNRIHHNRSTGLLIDSCYNSTVSNNLVYANQSAGISIYYIAGRNTIKENVLIQNGAGIDINLHWGGFGENRLYHNDFIGNRDQVQLKPTGESRFQLWDMGKSTGGNFWSDHPGGDEDGDGLCDAAYELAGQARDRFPFAKPRGRIRAELAVDPAGASLTGPGEWLMTYIELPAGLSLEDIDMSTILLNGSVSSGGGMGSAGDVDDDGIPDLGIRFVSADARKVLNRSGAGPEVVVTGRFKSGLLFEALVPSKNGA